MLYRVNVELQTPNTKVKVGSEPILRRGCNFGENGTPCVLVKHEAFAATAPSSGIAFHCIFTVATSAVERKIVYCGDVDRKRCYVPDSKQELPTAAFSEANSSGS